MGKTWRRKSAGLLGLAVLWSTGGCEEPMDCAADSDGDGLGDCDEAKIWARIPSLQTPNRAVDMASDNRIAAGESGSSLHRFPLPGAGESLTVTATLTRRHYAAAVADDYGWDVRDEQVAREQVNFTP